MERIPILRMGDLLLVTIQVDMHDQLALTLQEDLSEKISATSARGVLIDISALDIVDSFIGRMISTISGLAAIMDAKTVVVGMQPAVAITLVELGLTLPTVRAALNVERGMRLLQRIVDTGSEIAIIDITGVPTVDTLVAQHLLKTVTAIRLMGADAIISGVRPQIAQTIVHLGLDLQGIVTKANLADALALALKRTGVTVSKAG